MRRKSGHAGIDNHPGVVIASDEAGYGSWAGPLVVCAVAAPAGWDNPRVNDSKLLGASQRAAIFDELFWDTRFVIHVEFVEPETIDARGVYPCLLEAHGRSHRSVASVLAKQGAKWVSVIDGKLPIPRLGLEGQVAAFCLPKADSLVPECGLASIVAKHLHDLRMAELDKLYPEYRFGTNAGYGGNSDSPHKQALERLGPCPAHRKSYQPVADVVAARERASEPSMDELFSQLGEG